MYKLFLSKGALKAKTPSADETKGKEITKSENNPENTDKLSRKQWKSKMKNKRKCKNKYRQNKPDQDVNKAESADKQRPKEEVKIDSYSNNKNSEQTLTQTETPKQKLGKARKPQKRKNTEEETDISGISQTFREEKQLIEKEKKTQNSNTGKIATESFINGSKQKVESRNEWQQQTSTKKLKPELSKEQSLKREQLRKLLNSQETDQRESPAEQKEEPAAPEEEVKQDRSASLRFRMEQRLESARFRYINEVLYSTSSGEAKRMFRQDPQAFSIYHRGYTAQVERWPANPVDAIISYIQQR